MYRMFRWKLDIPSSSWELFRFGGGVVFFSLCLPLVLFACSSALEEERIRKMKSLENSLQGAHVPAPPSLRT